MKEKYTDLNAYIKKINDMKFREDVGILFENDTGIFHRIEGEIGIVIISLVRKGFDFNYIINYILQEYDVQHDELVKDINNFLSKIFNENSSEWDWNIEKRHGKLLNFPLRMEIEVTSLCNWNCGFCYNVWKIDPNLSDEDVKKKIKMFPQKHLPKEKILKILNECHDNGCFIVRYSGGETLLHPDIEEILEYGGKLGLYQMVFTNGHFLTYELAKRLKSYNVGTVLISLHGDKVIHNVLTGHNSAYEKAINAIKLLTKINIQTVVELTLVKGNYNSALEVMKEAYNCGARQFSVMRYVPTGKNDDKYGVPIEKMVPLMEKIDELQTEYTDLSVAWPCGQRMCTTSKDTPIQENDITLPLRIKQLTGHCEAGLIWGSISFTGHLRHCPHSNVYFGDVGKNGIKAYWDIMTRKVNEVLLPRESCSGCTLLSSCKGGCHLTHFFETNTNENSGCRV